MSKHKSIIEVMCPVCDRKIACFEASKTKGVKLGSVYFEHLECGSYFQYAHGKIRIRVDAKHKNLMLKKDYKLDKDRAKNPIFYEESNLTLKPSKTCCGDSKKKEEHKKTKVPKTESKKSNK